MRSEERCKSPNSVKPAGHRRTALLGVLLAAALLTTLGPSQAFASQTHLFQETFGSAAQPTFGAQGAMTVVQSSGDLLVIGEGENPADPTQGITRWKSTGEPDPFSALGSNRIDGAIGPGGRLCAEELASCDLTPRGSLALPRKAQVVVDESGGPTNGDIYVNEAEEGRVVIFASSGAYLGQLTKFGTKGFGEVVGIAVDPQGNLYVADFGKKAIHKFIPTANPVVNTDFAGDIAFERPGRIIAGAGSTAGSLFVDRFPGSGEPFAGGVYKLNLSSGTVEYPVLAGIFSPDEPAALAINPVDGHLFVGLASGGVWQIRDYEVSGPISANLASTIEQGRSTKEPTVTSYGVAVKGTTGVIYANAVSSVAVFRPAIVTQPDVTSGTAGSLTPSKATLNGTVNPDGQEVTKCTFEYATPTNSGGAPPEYEHSTGCQETSPEIGVSSSPVPVNIRVTGLSPEQTYYSRIVAENSNGVAVYSGSGEFRTPAAATTGSASAVEETEAIMNGSANPDGAELDECSFEYGPAAGSYGTTVPCAETPEEIGKGEEAVAVHASLSGLTPGATYHFRITSQGVDGQAHGSDGHFTTSIAHPTETLPATTVGGVHATLNGTVDPGGAPVEECRFEYGTGPALYESTLPCAESSSEIGTGNSPVPVHASVIGLAVGTNYHFRLVAGSTASPSTGSDLQFHTLGPKILGEWASAVSSNQATVVAEIEPGGPEPSVSVEWGPSSGPLSRTSPATIFAGTATADLAGLTPGVTYSYRFMASSECNSSEPTEVCLATGDSRTLETPAILPADATCANQAFREGSSSSLPDCRAYEMVSPVDKNGGDIATGLIEEEFGGLAESSESGDRATYSSLRSFGAAQGAPAISQYMSHRVEGAGWVTENITTSRENPPYVGPGKAGPFKGFTSDLCRGWVESDSNVALAPGSPDGFPNLYLQENCQGGPSYELLTSVTPAGLTPFATGVEGVLTLSAEGGSEGASHSIFTATAQLEPAACGTPGVRQLYETAPGEAPRVLSVLPNGTATCKDAEAGFNQEPTHQGFNDASLVGAISPDASKVFWTDTEKADAQTGSSGMQKLYLRLNALAEQSAVVGGECAEPAKACTIPISETPGATFIAASKDSSAVLYQVGGSLYEAKIDERPGEEPAVVPSLIASHVEGAGQLHSGVVGASGDLARFYVITREVLDPGEQNSLGREAVAEGRNLYLWENGQATFIATLAGSEEVLSVDSIISRRRSARTSSDGRYLTFTSTASLTGYDNVDQVSGKNDAEVYLFDSQSGLEGSLVCISCNPTGARPTGKVVMNEGRVEQLWAAALVPGWTQRLRPSRLLSDDGRRVFFDSFDALVPRDQNEAEDVYEWEAADGAIECEVDGAELYVSSSDGCLSLISSGQSPQNSEVIDASTGGRDVFLATSAGFVSQDPGLIDVYDAREGGGFPQALAPVACEGEACQGKAAAATQLTPGTDVIRPGNAVEKTKPCPKGTQAKQRHGRRVCVKPKKRAKKKPKPKGHKKSKSTKSKRRNDRKRPNHEREGQGR